MNPMNVLISLHQGYGLGDAVQMSCVLQHLAKHRPHWIIDYRAEAGREKVGRGVVRGVLTYDDPLPALFYDAEAKIVLYDTWANWGDRPNTRVSSCLHERFGLGWDPECGRYRVNVSPEAALAVDAFLLPFGSKLVAFHYQGDSSQSRKNLSHEQALRVLSAVRGLGWTPFLLDWRGASPLQCCSTGRLERWGRDAEMNCAVIRRCGAFVGIDSGPSKCASATDTPALVVWTGHHPAPFHDPAPNTTHLVPVGYHGLEPVCNDPGVVRWFEERYNVQFYYEDPVAGVEHWLKGVLK